MNNTFLNIFFNISMLVMLATLLVNFPFFQKVILHERSMKFSEKVLLGIIMGSCCIFSNYAGIQINKAVLNSRVIGALGAALLGGPISGIIAVLMGTIHRYYLEPNGITTVACCTATIVETMIGIGVWYYFSRRNKRYGSVFLFVLTAVCEALHMGILLLVARPYEQVVQIVGTIAIPMILFNAVGMVLFFSVFRNVYKQQDKQLSEKMILAFEIAEQSLPYLEKTLKEPDNFQKVIDIIMHEYRCEGVAIANRSGYLGKSAIFDGRHWEDQPPNIIKVTMEHQIARIWNTENEEDAQAIATKDIFEDLFQKNVAVTAPLIIENEIFGCIIMFIRRRDYYPQVELSFINGIANLFATQLTLAKYERQKKLLRQAEFQALQAQINPHFLFNALNTISFFCREKPQRARELLLALTMYLRNSLQDVSSMVTVSEELKHVRAYLEIEKARFEERLQVDIDLAEQCENDSIPNLILQPIVENAIKHGAMLMDKGIVKVHIYREKDHKLCLEIWNNGPPFPLNVQCAIQTRVKNYKGIGLWNVNERLISIYGEEAHLEIVSQENQSVVKMIIPQ